MDEARSAATVTRCAVGWTRGRRRRAERHGGQAPRTRSLPATSFGTPCAGHHHGARGPTITRCVSRVEENDFTSANERPVGVTPRVDARCHAQPTAYRFAIQRGDGFDSIVGRAMSLMAVHGLRHPPRDPGLAYGGDTALIRLTRHAHYPGPPGPWVGVRAEPPSADGTLGPREIGCPPPGPTGGPRARASSRSRGSGQTALSDSAKAIGGASRPGLVPGFTKVL